MKDREIRAAPEKHSPHIVRTAVRYQINNNEDENTGLQAANAAEQAGETVWTHGGQIYQTWRHRSKENVQRMEGSNPQSHRQQKQQLKRRYISEHHGKQAAGQTARKTQSVAEKLGNFAHKHRRFLLVLALGGLLLFVVQSFSALTPLMEAALHAMVMGTYPAEEEDILAAERYYRDKELAMEDELSFYDYYHPGYDHYGDQLNEIWHDPYALIALISAYKGGEEWTMDDAVPIMDMLFDWQYSKSEIITSQQLYRMETVDGEEKRVGYLETTCYVTLVNNNLSHAPVYIMGDEKVGLYALYMSTLGNMPDLFSGPHCSKLTEPREYDLPQELLDADPQFALLAKAANDCLGYPYVWGGYKQETSFDCSGFISWLFTSTGVDNIGHLGATGLYHRSRKITPEEAKPGDVVFFEGTMGGEVGGVTHCGLYVGNNMMIHCGNPCSYADLTDSYWQQHFLGFGRLYAH